MRFKTFLQGVFQPATALFVSSAAQLADLCLEGKLFLALPTRPPQAGCQPRRLPTTAHSINSAPLFAAAFSSWPPNPAGQTPA
jgi:hypothetical protein